ncbi:hypothetical protein HZI73_10725 [Vallitalea pronyensis]|uniref:Uncharacterized protein n=1 Tax=Vallitalea pronyensis TaxID=1348613 RepID=A0A8J8SGG1_9FIRM|nr:hypothetical protein [Vallitalea pronyensis]QUI22735.1 hypothetical protein HZI73_10725 [Vallitalea pronyensis]
MAKKTFEKSIEKMMRDLGMGDYQMYLENRVTELEKELKEIDKSLYHTKRNQLYFEQLKQLGKAGLAIEENINWVAWFENQHMYERGFKDALKFINNAIMLLQSLDD